MKTLSRERDMRMILVGSEVLMLTAVLSITVSSVTSKREQGER